MADTNIYYEKGLYCCECKCVVQPELTDGSVIYPHRKDLAVLPFWQCLGCGNYVGCHHKTADRTRPLGNIPTPAIKSARSHIHLILDPIWKRGRMTRNAVYAHLSERLGYRYHTAEIRSLDEARKVYRIIRELGANLL